MPLPGWVIADDASVLEEVQEWRGTTVGRGGR
jgi:hypothetical protein